MDKQTSIAATVVKERLQKSINWRNAIGLPSKWAENDRFESGDQWPAPTELTKTLPRPVYNFIRYVKRHQVSAVLNENIKMVFSNMEENEDESSADWGDIFSRYAETTWEEINQLRLNMKALGNAHSTGVGIWHYYYNTDYEKGKYLKTKGRMEGESLDPMNVFFGKPSELDVQKQPWIIIVKRESVEFIRELAKKNSVSAEDMERLKADNDTKENKYANAQTEQESEDGMANLVLTYFKRDGMVWNQFTCNDVLVKPAVCMKKKLYPVAIMNWEERKENIYGLSGTEGLIPNQRIINMLLALQVMSVQLSGFPKMIYKKGAINPRKIRNLLGEMIEDEMPSGAFNAQYMNPGQISPHANELVEGFVQYSKDLIGANDTFTGEAAPNNATAINLLQKASSVSLGDIKRRFYIAMEDIGRIWEEFWKVDYNLARVITIKDDDEKEVQLAARMSDASKVDMKLKIDIGPSSEYNEGYTLMALQELWQKGIINKPEQYIKYYPKNMMPFKESLLRDIEKDKLEQQRQTMEQLIGTMNPAERQIFSSSDPQTQQKILIDLASQQQQAMQAMQPPEMMQQGA